MIPLHFDAMNVCMKGRLEMSFQTGEKVVQIWCFLEPVVCFPIWEIRTALPSRVVAAVRTSTGPLKKPSDCSWFNSQRLPRVSHFIFIQVEFLSQWRVISEVRSNWGSIRLVRQQLTKYVDVSLNETMWMLTWSGSEEAGWREQSLVDDQNATTSGTRWCQTHHWGKWCAEREDNLKEWKESRICWTPFATGEGGVQDGEKARLRWICFRLPCCQPGFYHLFKTYTWALTISKRPILKKFCCDLRSFGVKF